MAFDASPDDIRRAYRALAVKVHPDLQGGGDAPGATERMALLNAAWAVLGDSAQRRSYDRTLFGEDDPYGTGWDHSSDEPMSTVAGLHSPRFRVSIALVLLVVLLVIFVFTAYAGTPTRP